MRCVISELRSSYLKQETIENQNPQSEPVNIMARLRGA